MGAVKTTFIFVVVSVAAHIVLGMCFALLLNTKYFKSRTKTIARVIYVLPWVFTASVIAILWKLMLQPAGIVDYLLSFLNLATKDTEWLSNQSVALATITFVNIWCGYPFYMISILAGLQGISEDLYESSALDGATKWKQICHITLPLLKPTIIMMTIMSIGRMFYSDFGLFYQMPMNSGTLFSTTQTIDTYVYRALMQQNDVGMSSAAGFYQSIVGFVLVLTANFIVRKTSPENAMF